MKDEKVINMKKRICTLLIETNENELLNALTTNPVCKSNNFYPVTFLCLPPENLTFGFGKTLIELEEWSRLYEAISKLYDIADLDSMKVVFGYFRRVCSKDYVREDATR